MSSKITFYDIDEESNQTTSDVKREFGMKLNYAKLRTILEQNVSKTQTRTFTQFTKDKIQQYIQNPMSNIDNIREVSNFLWRLSMPYKKIIEYISLMPLFLYNVNYKGSFEKYPSYEDFCNKYESTLKSLDKINMKEIFSVAIATALRDGIYVGYVYDEQDTGVMVHALDPKYCKVAGSSYEGNYVVKFNAAYFDSGDNKIFVKGIDDDGQNTWDKVFVNGYNEYKEKGRDFQWFVLPVDRTICLLSGDDPTMPLPYFLPIFTSLLDLLDLESILQARTELENYVLLISKIPLMKDSDTIDDFAIDIDTVQYMQTLIDQAVPSLCGTAYSPCDIEKITFDRSNSSADTDELSQSMNNLFNKVGISNVLFGNSTNSVGLKHSIKVDESLVFKFLSRIEGWMNYYISERIAPDFRFYFHRMTYFSQEEVVGMLKEKATLGGSAIDYFTATGGTPYQEMLKIKMESAIGIKAELVPLASSYTQSSKDSSGGAPTKDEDDLSDEGVKTRDGDKNGGGE